ncbi:Uncharacterised protein [uncultured archaeon]|nr:Uncharacterised protein [uncultured archaeon]
MYLKCECGREWDYQGKASFYAFCPKCKSKIRINTNNESPRLNLKDWAFTVPIEMNMPQNRNDVIAEVQRYAQKVFEESTPLNCSLVLNRVIRFQHSNYRGLLGEVDRKAKEQRATSDQILDACKIIKERIDSQIDDLRSSWSETEKVM